MDSGWEGRELIGNQTVICLKKITAVFTFVISLPNRSFIFYVNEQILESCYGVRFHLTRFLSKQAPRSTPATLAEMEDISLLLAGNLHTDVA